MGYTGLARWQNAPPTGLDLIRENIIKNHNGVYREPWRLSIRTFRSTLRSIPLQQPGSPPIEERYMCSITMGQNVYVLLDDPIAVSRSELLHRNNEATAAGQEIWSEPPHYRMNYFTLSPPGALELLLTQLKARWTSGRPQTNINPTGQPNLGGQLLIVEGSVFSIGTDWLVRAGKVVLTGGVIKGMLLEAEYLPMPHLDVNSTAGASELISNFLTSILPRVPDAKTAAMTMSEDQWIDVLGDVAAEDRVDEEKEKLQRQNEKDSGGVGNAGDDDLYVYGEDPPPKPRKRDWVGVERERRSAFLIYGALKSENII